MRQAIIIISGQGGATPGAVAVTDGAMSSKTWLGGNDAAALQAVGYATVEVDGATFDRIPDVTPITVAPR